ncbi:hypothetical protein NMY22_g1070 [Coprinellus aureogranulatus]|nr:hypothetical protein NMY22_g1070 [Coprinellus aureogranulatus]
MSASPPDPRFSQYFTANDTPSAQDLEDIRRYLEGPKEELEAVTRQIEDLELHLASLRSRQESLSETVQKYQGICSPIRALPEDILGEIFLQCLPDDRLPVIHVNDPPFLLTMVCRKWRTTALQTPGLWSQFHVVTNFYQTNPGDYVSPDSNSRGRAIAERQLTQLKLYISRSGALPLSFTLNDNTSYPSTSPSPVIQYIGTLLPRIRSIYWGSWRPFESFVTSQSATSFARLEKIALQWSTYDTFDTSNPPPYLLAPNLRDVEVIGFNTSPTALPLKWYQLTRLALPGTDHVVSDTALADLLTMCPKLQEGIFYVSGQEMTECGISDAVDPTSQSSHPPPHSRRIALPDLQSLDITHQDCIGALFRQLLLPRLSQLALRGDRLESWRGFHVGCLPMLFEHNEQCLPLIEKLIIRPGVYTPPSLVSCLERLPRLRTLILVDKNGSSVYHTGSLKSEREEFDEELLVRMTPHLPVVSEDGPHGDQLQCLCPRLQRFEFRESENYKSNRHLTLRTVVPFVAGKWEAAQRYPDRFSALKHIVVPSRTLPNESVKKALKPWRQKGLTVEIAHPGLDPTERPREYQDAWDPEPVPDVVHGW